jgi:hypothetical protein
MVRILLHLGRALKISSPINKGIFFPDAQVLAASGGNAPKMSPSLHNTTHLASKQTIHNFTHPHEENFAQLPAFNILEQLLLIPMVYPLTNVHKIFFITSSTFSQGSRS